MIGAGFGGTGTQSMMVALRHLGFGRCHSIGQVFSQPWAVDPWVAAVRGDDVDLAPLLDGFGACVGFPSCVVWRRLIDEHPAARVVLTARPADVWWESFDATIGPRFGAGLGSPVGATDGAALMRAIRDHVFGGRTDDRHAAVAAYEAHSAAVVDGVPADRLLVFDVAEGWQPLCAFLDVPIPDVAFPHENSTEEFQALLARIETWHRRPMASTQLTVGERRCRRRWRLS